MKLLLNCLKKHFPHSRAYLCDIGAREGLPPRWEVLKDFMNPIAFEPDPEEYARLKNKTQGQVYNYALGDAKAEATLNITQSPGCSSLLKPNFKFLSRFPDSKRFEVKKAYQLKVEELDSIVANEKIQRLDFIKVDTQGYELAILKGSRQTLIDKVLGIESEVEFSSMYEGQPLFRDIDKFVGEIEHFELVDLRKTYWKENGTEYLGSIKGQLIFGDVLYFRTLNSFLQMLSGKNQQEQEELIIAYIIMSLAYGYLDRIVLLLKACEQKNLLSIRFRKEFLQVLESSERRFHMPRIFFKVHSLLKFISLYFYPNHQGWAIAERGLGSEKKYNNWLF